MLAQASNSAGLSVHVEAGIGSPSPKSILSRSVHPMKRARKDGARKSERSFFCAGLGATKAWLPEPLLPGPGNLFSSVISALSWGEASGYLGSRVLEHNRTTPDRRAL